MSSRENEEHFAEKNGIRVSIYLVEYDAGHGNIGEEFDVRAVDTGTDVILASETVNQWHTSHRVWERMCQQYHDGIIPPPPPSPYDNNEAYGRF